MKSASITITPTSTEHGAIRKPCSGPGTTVNTVPDTRRGMPAGATRSESVTCASCGQHH